MAYLLLMGAILAEVFATALLKSTEGFSRPGLSVVCLMSYGASFFALAQAISRGLQVSVGYALWSAIGTALVATIGVLFLAEPFTLFKAAGLLMVVGGVVLLNMSSTN